MAELLTLDPAKGFHVCECNDLDDFYKELECDTFDIATLKIGGKYYDIFCDDLGLFKEDSVVSAVDTDCNAMLVGNLVFANHDDLGNTTSLSEEDRTRILSNALLVGDARTGRIVMAVECEY